VELDIDNAFAELGLSPGATALEIKSAWRRLVSKWHPDRNDSAAAVAKMQRINRAFKAIRQLGVLGNQGPPDAGNSTPARPEPANDEREGQARTDKQRAGAGGSAGASFGADHRAGGYEFDDGPTTSGKAADEPRRTINRKVKLTLEEAALGCTKVLQGKVTDACSSCEGAGYRVIGGHCSQCQGSGAVRQRAWFGWIGIQEECTACRGGGIARRPCDACDGTGKAQAHGYKFIVRIPHGVRDGDLLHVDGRRHKPGSTSCDLSIRVEVLKHDFLELDKDGTLRCEIHVGGFAWIANRAIDVPTLTGLHTVQLDRDQLSYRLRGQGFPIERRGPRGDQLIKVKPIFPRPLSTDQEILLDQLIATTSSPESQGVDERLWAWNRGLNEGKRGGQRRS
jgi:molecular chaperone DnaJ